jgi:chromatin segregation and condensation protein Rec8/ScpA/Scc1 (kleisin family)
VTRAPDAWEGPPRTTPGSEAPVLAVEGFEGPLPWLLELAREQTIGLRRLSILGLVEAFGRALQAALGGRADLRCRAALASTFLAGLELARDGAVQLEQPKAWPAVMIRAVIPRPGVAEPFPIGLGAVLPTGVHHSANWRRPTLPLSLA